MDTWEEAGRQTIRRRDRYRGTHEANTIPEHFDKTCEDIYYTLEQLPAQHHLSLWVGTVAILC